ncbi:hypothetical protein QFZ74_001806 [Streptomyces sp. V3I7]|nr:hypothetical protein [Streptomyces sp. V3I7]
MDERLGLWNRYGPAGSSTVWPQVAPENLENREYP